VKAFLALEDGTVFQGESFGAIGIKQGEVVFNTSMVGYQEILTDPSYCGQIVVMTYPLIGNYGINPEDMESAGPQVSGFVIRELCNMPSNFRSRRILEEFLKEHNIIGIQGIDTRALTRRLRNFGTMGGVITTDEIKREKLVELAQKASVLSGEDLPAQVSTKEPYTIARGQERTVVVIDFGVKRNIIRWLVKLGCTVTVVPAKTSAEEILKYHPDGIMLSNGPGDPKGVFYAVETIKKLLGKKPILGISLGHQLLGLALGADTYKLPFGHRGENHPVKDLSTGRVYITSQNHGFAIKPETVKTSVAEVSHLNLNDGTIEGLICKSIPAFSIQYCPEAFPGSNDTELMFLYFFDMIKHFK
jgi:carbamoyl-phosphate synthase small subunit